MAEGAWVLIVSGDQPTRNTLVSTLVEKGLVVIGAPNGKEALALARKLSFRLIVTDRLLPDTQAAALVRAIKKILPHASVIVVSEGKIPDQEWKELLAAGMNLELERPFSPDGFAQAVFRFL